MNTTPTIYKNKKGEIKYYASYQSAWKAAQRLNQMVNGGQWWFEADVNGWYLEYFSDDNTGKS
jgi:hypothetical protein